MKARAIVRAAMIALVILSTAISVQASDSSQPGKRFGAQTTIVILIEFSDVKHTLSKEQIYDMIIGKMSAYAREVSYNMTWFTGETTSKWYQLPNPLSYYSPWPGRVGEPNWDRQVEFVQAVVRMVDSEVDFSKYERVIIVHAGSGGFPPFAFGVSWYHCCPEWSSVSTNDGVTVSDLVVDAELDPPSVVVHEWLHYLGGYSRGSVRVKDLYDWSLLAKGEYSGIYVGRWDLMGGQWGDDPHGISSWTKIQLGWLLPSQVATVKLGQAAELKVDPLELPSTGIQAISIPLEPWNPVVYYLVEVRQEIGYDAKLPDSGVLVTLCDEHRSGEGPVRVQDANPRTSTLDDATFDLRVGKEPGFFDKKNDISIVITAKSGLSYTIFVGSVSQGEAVLQGAQKALDAIVAMDNANASIRTALLVGRTEDIENARSLLLNASRAFEKRDFDTALALAQQAKETADSATYPQSYYETKDMLARAGDLESRASSSSFLNSEAQALARQALSAHDSAKGAFARNDFNAARDYAQTAATLFEKAFSVEQTYTETLEAQEMQSRVLNYVLVGTVSAVLVGTAAIYVLRKKTRKLP